MVIWVDMERAYIGSLISGEVQELHWITEENFFVESNRKIFKSINLLLSENSPVDIVTVRSKLSDIWEFDSIWWNSTLLDIVDSSYSHQNIAYYANKMKKASRRSEVAKIATNLMKSVESWEIESGDIIWYADNLLGLNNLDSSEYSLDSIIEDTMEYIESRQGKKLFGNSFWDNLEFLDRYTKGIQKGRTYRIGAVSNLGKSQLAYNIITNLLDQNVKVAFFTLENEKSFTVTNIMANKERVNSHSVEDGSHNVDFGWLDTHKNNFYLIDEEYELSKIFARILEIKPDVVFIDYIGLINIHKVTEQDMYTQYARRIQNFVKKTKISLIDLSNLPKDADEDNIRLYGGFYGSSFLRNNTDVGIHLFYYSPFYEWRNKSWLVMDDKVKNIAVVTMLISKNRIWTAKVEQVFVIDFNKWGYYRPATEQELSVWNF